jgi:hypothetical protein
MKEIIFLKSAIQQFRDYKLLAERTFAQINEADFLYQPMKRPTALLSILPTSMEIC